MWRKNFLIFKIVTLSIITRNISIGQNTIPDYIKVETERINETYSILKKLATEIWPGWDNFNDIEFRIEYPNRIIALFNHKVNPDKDFSAILGIVANGLPIYLNSVNKTDIQMLMPFAGGGGMGNKKPIINLRMFGSQPTNQAGNSEIGISDRQILLNIHELFHGLQFKIPYFWKDSNQELLMNFKPSAEFATYSEIEGSILEKVADETKKEKLLELAKEYWIIRSLKKNLSDSSLYKAESHQRKVEGTASYIMMKTAIEIEKNNYKPILTNELDPYFNSFQDAKSSILSEFLNSIRIDKKALNGLLMQQYSYGFFECMLLDQLFPDWKSGFLEENKSFDDVFALHLGCQTEFESDKLQNIKSKYGWDSIIARYIPIIKERDEAISNSADRKGIKFIINYRKTNKWFAPLSRGKYVDLGASKIIFPNGILPYKVGDSELETKETLVEKTSVWTFEWKEKKIQNAKESYKIKYSSQQENIFKDVIIETDGFLLKANEVEIIVSTDEILILIGKN